MNIQQLRYVVATADEGSMTAAAAAQYVAQPALSRAIRALERELGVVLFAKAGRGICLTPAGVAFVVRARAVLRSVDALGAIADDASYRASDAPLVIAASPTLQASLAVPIIAALQDHGTALRTRLIGCTSSAAVLAAVEAGDADLGICDHLRETELALVPLGRTEVKLYAPAGIAVADPVSLTDLGDVPLVLPTPGSERRDVLDRFFDGCGIRPPVAVESDERNVWLAAVSSGVAACVWHSVEALGLPDGVTGHSFDPPLHRDLTAVHRNDEGTPARAALLDVLQRWRDLAHDTAPHSSSSSPER